MKVQDMEMEQASEEAQEAARDLATVQDSVDAH
jgi:hypothetical protein